MTFFDSFTGCVEKVLYQIHNGFPTSVSVKDSASEGESVTITAIASGQYSILVYDNQAQGGSPIAQTSGWVTQGATLTFTMPDADVYVVVTAKPR